MVGSESAARSQLEEVINYHVIALHSFTSETSHTTL